MLQADEGILYGEFDLSRYVEPKQFHDVVGYYNRFEILDLRITRERLKPASWLDRGDPYTVLSLEDDSA
jgi:aliphatic nitrilase